MVSVLLKFIFRPSALLVSKHRLIEGSLIAAFAVVAVSAWNWRFPPFSIMSTGSPNLKSETPTASYRFESPKNQKTHLVVLVHGYMGNSLEMKYLQEALLNEWQRDPSDSQLVVHSAKCNEGRTSDGIEAGGSRLAAEVNQLLQRFRQQNRSNNADSKLYLSLVGNSLGGLYARHAVSLLDWHLVDQPLDFVTTATPHLGVSYPHTYIPLNRGLEWVVANTLQQTGRDLFLQSPVMERLATDPKYLKPLQRFKRRVAYANSFGTDFQVPTATAGFLSPTSSSSHTIIQPPSSDATTAASTESFIVLTAQTPAVERPALLSTSTGRSEQEKMQTMVENLDALGWTKVFCDVRESLPAIPLPLFQNPKPENLLVSFRDVAASAERVATSKELHDLLTKPSRDKWHFPAGHSVLVANSRNDLYSTINKWGRPVMDRLARDILNDLVFNDKSDKSDNNAVGSSNSE